MRQKHSLTCAQVLEIAGTERCHRGRHRRSGWPRTAPGPWADVAPPPRLARPPEVAYGLICPMWPLPALNFEKLWASLLSLKTGFSVSRWLFPEICKLPWRSKPEKPACWSHRVWDLREAYGRQGLGYAESGCYCTPLGLCLHGTWDGTPV